MTIKADHWDSRTLKFILAPALAQSKGRVRIATGFFTVEGYDLIRAYLAGKHVQLMVGYDETSRERLRDKLIDDIMFYLSTWDGLDRRAAVLAMVRQLEQRRLQVVEQSQADILDARLRKRDHAKVFIVDDTCVVTGSGNLTVNGLRRNVEGMTTVTIPKRVAYWVSQFESYWNDKNTVDLTQALLESLRRWLDLYPPYDVYLKTIDALIGKDDTEPPRADYKMPVQYQMVVIERVLRQLDDWGGAMLVASTGLGKTVMATHIAYRLKEERKIYNVLVFAPLQVLPNWEDAMESVGVHCKFFTRNLLDQPLTKPGHEVGRMVKAIERTDDKYIIFVDESQYFKNMLRAKDGTPRYSFRRLFEAVNKRSAKIVLLTATPLAKGVQDLNNQLYLLPHTAAEPIYVTKGGQFTIPGFRDDLVHPNAWKVCDGDNFFDEFIDLQVSTVISTSQVAKDFAEHTPEGDYVQFGDTRKWIPQIEIKKIKVPAPLEREMSKAIRGGYFKHKVKHFKSRGVWQRSETTIEKEAEVAWTSSPPVLREVIQKTLDGTYDEKWLHPEKQAAVLTPILEQLEVLTYRRDEKFLTLCKYLREAYDQQRKVIIFTERHTTAVYLEESLARKMPQLSIANVSRRTEKGCELKNFAKEVYPLIVGFAPEANAEADPKIDRTHYDVFLTTDAYSIGVNLQDASVVISYDLAWTPDTIIQRAGRVLRFWKRPRLVSLYVFVGDFREDKHGLRSTQGVEKRLRTLSTRSQQAQQFSELPVFPKEDAAAYESLGDLSKVTIENLGFADITEIEEFTGVSGYLRHITELKQNQERAAIIPDDISSAMTYDGDRHLLYLLLHHKRTYYWMLYDIGQEIVTDIKEDNLLNLIQCTPDTPVANVDPNEIELRAQECRSLWLAQKTGINPALVERICALYLLPYRDKGDTAEMLKASLPKL